VCASASGTGPVILQVQEMQKKRAGDDLLMSNERTFRRRTTTAWYNAAGIYLRQGRRRPVFTYAWLLVLAGALPTLLIGGAEGCAMR
jgi:hypothetical protein